MLSNQLIMYIEHIARSTYCVCAEGRTEVCLLSFLYHPYMLSFLLFTSLLSFLYACAIIMLHMKGDRPPKNH